MAEKLDEIIDQASRLMASGWRGNPNMSGDDRNFMSPSMRMRHDEKARTVVEFVLQALRPGSTGETEGWRDIESAPKDRHVLLFGKQVGEASDVQFKGEFVTAGYWDGFDESWCLAGSNWAGPFFTPTAWRPLPSPPSAMLAAAGATE